MDLDRTGLPNAEGQKESSEELGQPRKPRTVTFASPLKQSHQTSPKDLQGNNTLKDSSSSCGDGGNFVKPGAPRSGSGKSPRKASFRELGQMAEQHVYRLEKFQEQILELEVQYARMLDTAASAMDPSTVAVLELILTRYGDEEREEYMMTDENEQKFIGLSTDQDEMN